MIHSPSDHKARCCTNLKQPQLSCTLSGRMSDPEDKLVMSFCYKVVWNSEKEKQCTENQLNVSKGDVLRLLKLSLLFFFFLLLFLMGRLFHSLFQLPHTSKSHQTEYKSGFPHWYSNHCLLPLSWALAAHCIWTELKPRHSDRHRSPNVIITSHTPLRAVTPSCAVLGGHSLLYSHAYHPQQTVLLKC